MHHRGNKKSPSNMNKFEYELAFHDYNTCSYLQDKSWNGFAGDGKWLSCTIFEFVWLIKR